MLLCVSSVFSQTGASAQGKASFQPQDVEFPAVEGWRLGPKSAIPMEQSGIIVNYDSPDRERMTVYVYSRGKTDIPNELSGIIKDEFEGAKNALRTVAEAGIYSNLKIVKSETATVGGATGKVKALRAVLSFEAGGNKLNSELFVFPYKGHVVKLRISRPAALAMDAESYTRLLSALDNLFSR